MTCICGHHEAVHHAMCGAPEGCDCTKFRKPAPEPTPFVDETKAVQDAMWLAGSEADTAERNLARAYLTLVATLADAQADKARLDWWDRIWEDDDQSALDLVWYSSATGPAGSGRAAIDAAMVAMPTTETPE